MDNLLYIFLVLKNACIKKLSAEFDAYDNTEAKHFISGQNLVCLSQHPKKLLTQRDTSREKKLNDNQ